MSDHIKELESAAMLVALLVAVWGGSILLALLILGWLAVDFLIEAANG